MYHINYFQSEEMSNHSHHEVEPSHSYNYILQAEMSLLKMNSQVSANLKNITSKALNVTVIVLPGLTVINQVHDPPIPLLYGDGKFLLVNVPEDPVKLSWQDGAKKGFLKRNINNLYDSKTKYYSSYSQICLSKKYGSH